MGHAAVKNEARQVVREVGVPDGSLVRAAFEKTSFEDAWAVELPQGASYDVDALARVLAQSAPRWADRLMWLRDRIVSVVGLRTSEEAPPGTSRAPLRAGDKVSIFEVLDRTDDEILFGADDKHLDFRASLLVQHGDAPSVVLSTVVRYNNALGRVYFFFVRPFHWLIMKSLMREFGRRVAAMA
jgi:hypothetical protein